MALSGRARIAYEQAVALEDEENFKQVRDKLDQLLREEPER